MPAHTSPPAASRLFLKIPCFYFSLSSAGNPFRPAASPPRIRIPHLPPCRSRSCHQSLPLRGILTIISKKGILSLLCGCGGMADTGDLKSPALIGVRVRAPPSALLVPQRFAAFLFAKKKPPKGRLGTILGTTTQHFSKHSSKPSLRGHWNHGMRVNKYSM